MTVSHAMTGNITEEPRTQNEKHEVVSIWINLPSIGLVTIPVTPPTTPCNQGNKFRTTEDKSKEP